MRRIHPLVWIFAAIGLLYLPVVFSYACGYDDYTEANRAAFEDSEQPSRIFTTSHFGTNKYRPLGRIQSFVNQKLFGSAAWTLRAKNLAFHFLAAWMIYRIALLLGGTRSVAIAAAALFGLHPLTNQTIVAAVFTNSSAYGLGLAALERYMAAFNRPRPGGALFAGGALNLAALFTYEPAIAVCGSLLLFLALAMWKGLRPAAGWPVYLMGAGAAVVVNLGAMGTARMAFVSAPNALANPVKNVALNIGTLLFPIDLVGASVLLGTPLPNHLLADRSAFLRMALVGGVILLGFVAYLATRPGFRRRVMEMPMGTILWAAGSALAAMVPFVIFTGHPSETYLYLPCAFWCIVVAFGLGSLLPNERTFGVLVALLLLVQGVAVEARSSRVRSCADCLENIVQALPLDRWRTGSPRIQLAPEPGNEPPPRFGIYSYFGIGTIDPLEPGIPSADKLLELLTHNPNVQVEVSPVPIDRCTPQTECFAIDLHGKVREIR